MKKMKNILASSILAAGLVVGSVVAAAPAQAATNVRVCNAGSSSTYLDYKVNSNTSYRLWPGSCNTGNISSVSAPSGYSLVVNGIYRTQILVTNEANRLYSIHVVR